MSDNSSPFGEAIAKLKLSPQEQNLYWHHLGNLYGDGKVIQPSGEVSTLLQTVAMSPDGQYRSIPTVWDGKMLDRQSAAQRAAQQGWQYWPGYATPEQAQARYDALHDYLERDTTTWEETHR